MGPLPALPEPRTMPGHHVYSVNTCKVNVKGSLPSETQFVRVSVIGALRYLRGTGNPSVSTLLTDRR